MFKKAKKWLKSVAVALVFSLVGVMPALADVPAVVGTTLTAIQTDALAMIDLVWPVVGSILGAFILLKLFKRAGNKV